MDDESQENSAIEETSKEAKQKAVEIVQNEHSNFLPQQQTMLETTNKQPNTKTLKETPPAAAAADEATLASTIPNNPPHKTTVNSFDMQIEIEMEKRQYFLAEAESAPKHLIRYTEQESLTKLMQAYSEQCNSNETNDQNKQSPLTDEPSCSKMFEEQNFQTDLHKKATTTMKQSKMPTNILPQNAVSSKEFIGLLSDGIENQSQHQVFGLSPAAVVAAAATVATAATTQKPFTTVIAGTTIVIPTALTASKPAESPTPPMESSEIEPMAASSVPSIGSLVCRICHNSENPERLVSPCLCKGSLSYVHIHCLERWISTSRSTVCELCQFQYKTEQTLRYTCIQSLRMWYSRSMSRRALQEDCQMFSLLTLVAFGIIGTLLVGIQYYFIQGRHWGLSSMWTKGWLLFFLFTTLIVYFINIYMIIRSQLAPWYRWWQSARDIKLILENRKPFKILHDWRSSKTTRQRALSEQQQQQQLQQQQQQQQSPILPSALPAPQPAAATAQNSNIPQIPTTPIAPVISSSVCAMATASTTLSMHHKISRECNATTATNKMSPAAASASAIATASASVTTAICGAASLSHHRPNTIAVGGLAALKPYSNKLHISVELTTTAAEIIEIPLENIDRCAFEYAKSKTSTPAPTTMTTATNV